MSYKHLQTTVENFTPIKNRAGRNWPTRLVISFIEKTEKNKQNSTYMSLLFLSDFLSEVLCDLQNLLQNASRSAEVNCEQEDEQPAAEAVVALAPLVACGHVAEPFALFALAVAPFAEQAALLLSPEPVVTATAGTISPL